MMTRKILPSVECLKRRFRLDRRTGALYYKKQTSQDQPSSHRRNLFNSNWAGKEAGHVGKVYGYRTIGITVEGKRVLYYAHRIVWKMCTGEEPPTVVDHKNGEKLDNRFCNLRDGKDQMLNNKNAKKRKDNTSGTTGVFLRENGTYRVIRRKDKIWYRLGTYKTIEEAIAVNAEWQAKQNFSPRHGL